MQIFLFVSGAVISGLIIYFIFKMQITRDFVARSLFEQTQKQNNDLMIKINLLEELFKKERAQLNDTINKLEASETELKNYIAALSAKDTALFSAQEQQIKLETELTNLKILIEELTLKLQTAEKDKIELNIHNKTLEEKLTTQKKEIEDLQKKFDAEFQNLANRILEEKSVKFTELNKNNLENLLKPLADDLKKFEIKVEQVYQTEAKERHELSERIKMLAELNQKISDEANNLASALKGQVKTVGTWGEMILEKILENSGLQKDREYFIQTYLKDENNNKLINETGKKMQPDVIIKLPENREILIDSKISLKDYTNYCSATNDEERAAALKNHINSIQNHIKNLSEKDYSDYKKTLDFVFMFIPIEAAYMLAMQNAPTLWNEAFKKKIVLISPTNLIAVLKLVENLWKYEQQNKNIAEIINRGNKLYEKFATFAQTIKDIGDKIDKLRIAYDTALTQLSTGKGNLISQVEKLKLLGLNPKTKELILKSTTAQVDELETAETNELKTND